MINRGFYKEKKCIVCGKKFRVRKNKNRKGRSPTDLRQGNAKTCSKECSKKYGKDRNRY